MNFSEEEIKTMLLKIEFEIARQRMSKKEFYEKSGISSSLYSQWNTGTVKPTMKSLGRIADALGISVEFLTGKQKVNSHPSDDEDEEMADVLQLLRDRDDLRALLHVSAKNTPEQVKKLTELMETWN